MRPRFTGVLKALAVLAQALLYFPLCLLQTSLLGGLPLIRQGLLVLCAVAGYGIGFLALRLADQGKLSVPLCNLTRGCAALLVYMLFFAAYRHAGWLTALPLALLAAVAAFVGMCQPRKPYALILSDGVFRAALFLYIGVVPLLWLLRRAGVADYSLGALSGVFLVFLGIYGLVRNQSNIDYMMERRRHSLEHLPRRIRYYNAALMGVASVLIILCFLLRDWVAKGLLLLWEAVRFMIGILILFVVWLINKLTPLEQSAGGEPVGGAPPQGMPPAGESGSDVWLNALVIVLCVFLLIRYRKKLFALLKKLVLAVVGLVRRLLNAAGERLRPDTGKRESEYYSDSMEALEPRSAQGIRDKRPAGVRAFRKGLRAYQRMEEGAEKYRAGYRLVLLWARAVARDDSPGCTARELLDRTLEALPLEDYPAATAGYEAVRYDEREPEPMQMQALNRTLDGIARSL